MKTLIASLAAAFVFSTATTQAQQIIDTDRLNEGQTMTYTVHLQGGQFARYVAVGDADGLDLDMYAYAPDGRCLFKDILPDARPVVQFVAPYTGTYRITIKMHNTFAGRWAAYQLIRL